MDVDANEVAGYFRNDPELADALPVRPRMAAGVACLPHGHDALLVVGGADKVLLRGEAARGNLLALLPLLDGTRSTRELAEQFPTWKGDDIFSALCLLYTKGLLEEGVAQVEHPVAAFSGRHLALTRFHGSRASVMRLLSGTRVVVSCPEALRDATIRDLLDSGLGHAMWRRPGVAWAHDAADIVLQISLAGDETAAQEELLTLWRLEIPAFRARLGDRTEIGPFFLPGRSACPACARDQLPTPDRETRSLGLGDAAVVAHRFFMTIARLAHNVFYNWTWIYDLDSASADRPVKIMRLPGCRHCGLAHLPALGDDEQRTFLRHFETEMVPRAYLSPSFHQGHYSARNIAHTRNKAALTAGSRAVPFSPAMLRERLGDAHWLVGLSHVLQYGFGYRPDPGAPLPMRYVPSGGGLDSPTPFLALTGVDGVADGAYRFTSDTLSLQPVPVNKRMLSSLLAGFVKPAAHLWVLSDYQRVAVKYGRGAFRICGLDAGVSLAHLTHLVSVFKTPADMSVAIDGARVLSVLGLARHATPAFVPAYMSAFGPSPWVAPFGPDEARCDVVPAASFDRAALDRLPRTAPPANGKDWIALDDHAATLDAIVRRRAVRSFAPSGISLEQLQPLLCEAARVVNHLPLVDLAAFRARLWLIVNRDGEGMPRGVYRADLSPGGALTAVRSDVPLHAEEFLNQTSLSAAPILGFVSVDLHRYLETCGPAGYRAALMTAGAIAAGLWIGATRAGVGGCIGGGLIESAVRLATRIDGVTDCPLVAFAMGHSTERRHDRI